MLYSSSFTRSASLDWSLPLPDRWIPWRYCCSTILKKDPYSLPSQAFWSLYALGRNSFSMFSLILVGIGVGFLSGLGVGGGSLLMLWLTAACKMEYTEARKIGLMFFIPPAAICAFHHLHKSRANLQTILPASLAGCISALFFVSVSVSWNLLWIKRIFGVFLLITAFRELRWKK